MSYLIQDWTKKELKQEVVRLRSELSLAQTHVAALQQQIESAPPLPKIGDGKDGVWAKGLADTIAACLAYWKNELEVEGRKPPIQTDMALLAEVLIYGCRMSASTPQVDAGREET